MHFLCNLIMDLTITLAISTQLTAEIDYLTLEYLPHAGFSDKTGLILFIFLIFSFFMFTKPNKKLNEDILTGVYLCPVILLALFGTQDNQLKEMLGSVNGQMFFNGFLNSYSIINVLIIIFSILMVGIFFYELFKLNNLKKAIKKIILIFFRVCIRKNTNINCGHICSVISKL